MLRHEESPEKPQYNTATPPFLDTPSPPPLFCLTPPFLVKFFRPTNGQTYNVLEQHMLLEYTFSPDCVSVVLQKG